MIRVFKFFIFISFIIIQGCGTRDETVMENKFTSLSGCLSAMEEVSNGPLDIIVDKPENVSGRLANNEYFGCQLENTGTMGSYYYGYYFVFNGDKNK